jgi:endonuclease YncB( thermonuclease family)
MLSKVWGMNLNAKTKSSTGIIAPVAVFIVICICICAGVVVLYLKGGTAPSAPSAIRNLEALYITSSDAILKAEYNAENQWSNVKARFEYKEGSSDTWSSTDWQEIPENAENGVLYENIYNLTPGTQYEFKAILQHDSEEISSPICSFETYAIPLNYEAYGTVDYTVDGDTIQVTLTWVNPSTAGVYTGPGQKVRFSGGIDAPELANEGGEESKSFVRNFCPWMTEVFLDLDNLSDDPYHDSTSSRRLLGVVYVKKDGKWVNVNAEVLRWGQEAYPDHDWLKYRYYSSEFNPDEWLADNYPYVL